MNRIFHGWRERKWFDIAPLPATPEADPALAALAAAASSSSDRSAKRWVPTFFPLGDSVSRRPPS